MGGIGLQWIFLGKRCQVFGTLVADDRKRKWEENGSKVSKMTRTMITITEVLRPESNLLLIVGNRPKRGAERMAYPSCLGWQKSFPAADEGRKFAWAKLRIRDHKDYRRVDEVKIGLGDESK